MDARAVLRDGDLVGRLHPDVAEIAVVGVPDARWGEAPVACVVTANRDLTLAELHAFAADSLAHFKRGHGPRLSRALSYS